MYDEQAVQRLLVIEPIKPLELALEQVREFLDATSDLATGQSVQQQRELTRLLGGYQRSSRDDGQALRALAGSELAAGLAR